MNIVIFRNGNNLKFIIKCIDIDLKIKCTDFINSKILDSKEPSPTLIYYFIFFFRKI